MRKAVNEKFKAKKTGGLRLVILSFLFILSGGLVYANSPQIISASMVPANPGWGQQFVLTLQMCLDEYSTPNELLVAISTSNTFKMPNTVGQVFLISSDGINIPDINPDNASSGTNFGYNLPIPSPFVQNCNDCGGTGSGMLVTESYILTVPNAQQIGMSACNAASLNLLIGAQSSYLGGSIWTALSNGACSSNGSAQILSWPLPIPPANSLALNNRVLGELQNVGDLVLFSIDYTYGNGLLTITNALPGGGSLALVSYGTNSISGGSVTAPAIGSISGTVTWTFPSSTYTKMGTVWLLMSMTSAMASGTAVMNTANAAAGSNNASTSATLIVGDAAISVQKMESVGSFIKLPNDPVTITYCLNYQVEGAQLEAYRAFDDIGTGAYTNPTPPQGWKFLPQNGDYGTWTISDACNTGDRIITGSVTGTAHYPGLLLDDPIPANVQMCDSGIIESDIMINPGNYVGSDALIIIRSNGLTGNAGYDYGLLLSIDTAPAGGYVGMRKCGGGTCSWPAYVDPASLVITSNTWYRVKIVVSGNGFTFNAKVWQVGQPEPTAYQLTYTDTTSNTDPNWECPDNGGTNSDWRPGIEEEGNDQDGSTQDSYNNFIILIPRTAANVTLYDTVPTGLIYQSSNPSGTLSGSMLSWNLGSLSDQSGSYTWWASTSACNQSYTNVAGIAGTGANGPAAEFSNAVMFDVSCISPTFTYTVTPSFTATPVVSSTPTFTPTVFWTALPTSTATLTNTSTLTRTITMTLTPVFGTGTTTNTPTFTPTVTNTLTPIATWTFTPPPGLGTSTNTQTYTPTFTPTVTQTYTLTCVCTVSLTPTCTTTLIWLTTTGTATSTSTLTWTKTSTPTATATSTPIDTATMALTPTATNTQVITGTGATSITKTASAACAGSNGYVTYYINYINVGATTINAYVIWDTVPAQMNVAAISGTGTNNAGVINWTFPTLGAGQGGVVSWVGQVTSNSGTIVNTAMDSQGAMSSASFFVCSPTVTFTPALTPIVTATNTPTTSATIPVTPATFTPTATTTSTLVIQPTPATSQMPCQTITLLQNIIYPAQGQYLTIHYSLYQQMGVEIIVYDRNGILVKTIANDQENGNMSITWNGTNDGGQTVASGIYLIYIKLGQCQATEKVAVIN